MTRSTHQRTWLLERLEDRLAPAAVIDEWIGGPSTSWGVAKNWNTGKVPGQQDDVIIGPEAKGPVGLFDALGNPENVIVAKLTIRSDSLVLAGKALEVTSAFMARRKSSATVLR